MSLFRDLRELKEERSIDIFKALHESKQEVKEGTQATDMGLKIDYLPKGDSKVKRCFVCPSCGKVYTGDFNGCKACGAKELREVNVHLRGGRLVTEKCGEDVCQGCDPDNLNEYGKTADIAFSQVFALAIEKYATSRGVSVRARRAPGAAFKLDFGDDFVTVVKGDAATHKVTIEVGDQKLEGDCNSDENAVAVLKQWIDIAKGKLPGKLEEVASDDVKDKPDDPPEDPPKDGEEPPAEPEDKPKEDGEEVEPLPIEKTCPECQWTGDLKDCKVEGQNVLCPDCGAVVDSFQIITDEGD